MAAIKYDKEGKRSPHRRLLTMDKVSMMFKDCVYGSYQI